MDQLIRLYFELGIKYANIVLLHNDKHDYEISESKHQLILTMRGLTRAGVGPFFSPGISGPRPAHFFHGSGNWINEEQFSSYYPVVFFS